MNFTEMSKLWLTLAELDVNMTVRNLYDGYQILGDGWDAICHSGSFGHENGLIEVMIGGDVSGYLTAQEAYELIAVVERL